jgi:hypothetical protein
LEDETYVENSCVKPLGFKIIPHKVIGKIAKYDNGHGVFLNSNNTNKDQLVRRRGGEEHVTAYHILAKQK